MSKALQELRCVANEGQLSGAVTRYHTFVNDILAKPTAQAEQEAAEFLAELDALEFNLMYNRGRIEASIADAQHFDTLYAELEQRIVSAAERIALLKEELQIERRKRRHREEYDAISRVILQQRDRDALQRDITQLRVDVQSLTQEKTKLSGVLELRSKQFQLLLTCIEDLETELEDTSVWGSDQPQPSAGQTESSGTTE
eukprot:TRINITY_DN16122_c0_g1_i1.p1 TRINITY_DN16122_c0_g1~~TRINITY_DN16122_c0_g1_i1.p1  ORF type:complete len:200 (-),score=50.44 TRINITY_DN16122_c0_g1_i1:7-606(-)